MNKTSLLSALNLYTDGKSYLDTVISKRNGRKIDYYDSRTKIIDGIPHVYLVGLGHGQVYICCPYCHEFHTHGENEVYTGHRESHCSKESISGNKGYIIEKLE